MFENFNKPVDIYCERLSAAFWAEPVNALSNFAFILAAVFALSLCRQKHIKTWDIKLLIILCAIVGIGSFIFHTVATHGAMFADIFPIIIFIFFATSVIFTRICGLKWWQSIIGVIAFTAFNALILNAFGRALFNGSIQYVPTFLLLLSVAIYSYVKRHHVTHEFLIAAAAFLIALTCRSLDMMVCSDFPLGTHFMWHILNAVVMYYVMKGLIKSAQKGS